MPFMAALPLIASGIGALGSIFSGGAKGASQGRQQENLAQGNFYRDQIAGLLGAGQLDLAQRQFQLQAPQQRMGMIGRADLLQNAQDYKMGGPGNWQSSGGLRLSALGPQAREAAQLMAAQQLQNMRQGDQFERLRIPAPPQYQKAGFAEKLFGGLGMAGSLFGGLDQAGLMPKAPLPNYGRILPIFQPVPNITPSQPLE